MTTETMPVRVKADTDAGASDVRSYGAAPPAAPTRVLVADGDPSVVATLTGMLEDAGYETFSTTDGLAAIDAASAYLPAAPRAGTPATRPTAPDGRTLPPTTAASAAIRAGPEEADIPA